MKQIKEIFRRSTSRWLALELILVTFTLWWAFDPVIVTNYVTHLPLGYDVDRMVKLDVAILTEGIAVNELSNEEERLLQKVQEMDEVELAYRAHNNPMGYNTITMPGFFFNDKGDSIQTQRYGFIQDSKMFEVYGIHSLTPSVPDSELTHDCEWEKTVIFTRSLAMGLFGTIDVAGRNVLGMKYGWDEESRTMGWHKEYFHIRAVVEDVRYQTYDRNYATLFYCASGADSGIPIILRLREGVNAERFVQEHQKEILNEIETEHCYIRNIQTASEAKDKQLGSIVLGRLTRRNLLIAAFFATNMAFGVLGTLLMYTRQRREEAGVKRAFGATRWSIFWGFIREAWLLTTICVIIGCIIYFQFAAAKGLFDGFTSRNPAVRLWFDDFGTHFMVVSLIVYLIILCAVLLGTVIPAWRICRSEITASLREE
ncbi:MAG: FtsX-like permease family protein [Bacteroidaceae bacterium]|nr:FtsX-like permease family protein [Bacteroidaceae bacterium]